MGIYYVAPLLGVVRVFGVFDLFSINSCIAGYWANVRRRSHCWIQLACYFLVVGSTVRHFLPGLPLFLQGHVPPRAKSYVPECPQTKASKRKDTVLEPRERLYEWKDFENRYCRP